jgi:hypothetical protein
MPAKRNPLGLNPLQLKTLTLLQELARTAGDPVAEEADTGGIAITHIPQPHGDHFHIGAAVASSRDATGLNNPSVWMALSRKGLIEPRPPGAVILTALGQEYDTGLRDAILQHSSH